MQFIDNMELMTLSDNGRKRNSHFNSATEDSRLINVIIQPNLA